MPPSDLSISIELSSSAGEVAVRVGEGSVICESIPNTGRHSDELIPTLDRLVRRAGRRPGDLGLVSLCLGPGSFTGLRRAVTTAKLLWLSTGCVLVGLPTSDVVAGQFLKDADGTLQIGDVIAVLLAAKRGQAWTAKYRVGDDQCLPIQPPSVLDIQTLTKTDHLRAIVADQPTLAMIGGSLSPEVRMIEARFCAKTCLLMGLARALGGQSDDPHRLLPLYGREPEAVRLWESRKS